MSYPIPRIADVSTNVPYNNKTELKVTDAKQNTPEIIKYILWSHDLDKKDYEKIAPKFWRNNAADTARLLFDFHKKYIDYRIEPVSRQTVKSPGNILNHKHGDCKHYSLFTTGIAEALNRLGYPISSFYRFVADDPNMEVHHVFSVILDEKGNEIWVDPVLKTFNARPKFHNITDKHMKSGVGAIYRLSGTHNFQNVAMVGEGGDMGNIFKRFGKAMQTNFANLGKDVKHVATEVKDVVNKQVHAAQVNINNAKKDAKHLVKEAGQVADKVKSVAIKVAALPARKAFLGLVALNVHGFATSLDAARKNPADLAKLKQKWTVDVGGDMGTLNRTIDTGMKKKRILGPSDFIGMDPATMSAAITLATAIIALMGPLLKMKPATQAALNTAATAGAATMLANAYTATQNAGGTNDINAAAAALNTITKQNQDNMNMAVIPGVAADGTPELYVQDVSSVPGGVPGSGGGVLESLINTGKGFIADNKVLVIGAGVVTAGVGVAMMANKKNKNKSGSIMAIAAGLGIAAVGAKTDQRF